jgi:hypothetical protein
MALPNNASRLLFLMLCFLYVIPGQGQDVWTIEGTILDENNKALAQALVYANPSDSSGQFIDFTYTDDAGFFELSIPAERATVLLKVQYLGYEAFLKPVAKSPDRLITVTLKPASKKLKEVVVSEKRLPITEHSDTTTYNLEDFRDSTDYTVEDLIRKLPGVQVNENGQINVNGKPIKTVLVEGDDLLGKRYDIATKGIRSDFIGKIEVIDHYQENPVLKDVNLSDDVVLNLLLKEDKKNIISGTLNAGAGYGEEWKALLHANIFSISRKHKVIGLTDNGNIGQHYGVGELRSTYLDQGYQDDLRGSSLQPPSLLNERTIRNPGLPAAYIDNGRNYFSTLRSIHKLNESWKLQANGIYAQKEDQQRTSQQQSYGLEDNTFDLNTSDVLRIQNKFWESDLLLSYIQPDNERSWQTYLNYQQANPQSQSSTLEIRPEAQLDYQTSTWEKDRTWQLVSLYSEKWGQGSVAQARVKLAGMSNPQRLSLQDEPPLPPSNLLSLRQVDQTMEYGQRYAEALGRWLWASGRHKGSVTTTYSYQSARFENFLNPIDSVSKVLLENPGKAQEHLDRHRVALSSQWQFQLDNQTELRANLSAGRVITRLIEEYFEDYPFRAQVSVDRVLSDIWGINFRYGYSQSVPTVEHYFSVPFLAERYLLMQSAIQSNLESGHSIRGRLQHKDEFKFRSAYLSIGYQFAQQFWRQQVRFEPSLQIAQPYYSRGNIGFTATAGFDQFFPKSKISLEARPAYSLRKTELILAGKRIDLSNESLQLLTAMHATLFKRLKINLRHTLRHTNIRDAEGATSGANQVLASRSELELFTDLSSWSFSAVLNHSYYSSPNGLDATLWGSQLRASKSLTFLRKPTKITLSFFNPINIQSFQQLLISDYLILQDEVEAIAPYLLLNWDVTF